VGLKKMITAEAENKKEPVVETMLYRIFETAFE